MNQSLWLEPIKQSYPPLMEAISCDVLVIGAGLCGASAALHLADQGISVVLLEARTVAESASGRNAGFLLQGTAERYARAVTLLGRERARSIHQLSLDNHHQIADFITNHGVDVAYQKRGSLQLAGSVREEEELLESAALLRADGFSAVELTRSELPVSLQGSFSMGVAMPEDGELDPGALVREIVAAAAGAGVRVFEDSRVTMLDAYTMGEVVATTQSGRVDASVVVVATNARAGELLPWMSDKVDPVRGQMLATAPDKPLFNCPIYANHGYDYWRQTEEGRIVLGGWRNLDPENEVGHDELVSDDIQSRMVEFLNSVGVTAPVTHRWAGIMGFSRDGLPLVGPVPGSPGAVVGAGFTGHGFGFAYAAGSALAELVLEGTSPLTDLLSTRRLG